jgi:hypothetical protein
MKTHNDRNLAAAKAGRLENFTQAASRVLRAATKSYSSLEEASAVLEKTEKGGEVAEVDASDRVADDIKNRVGIEAICRSLFRADGKLRKSNRPAHVRRGCE